MIKADIGLIGLGVMGANLALNIAEKGFRVAVFNRTTERTRAFVQEAGPLSERMFRAKRSKALRPRLSGPAP